MEAKDLKPSQLVTVKSGKVYRLWSGDQTYILSRGEVLAVQWRVTEKQPWGYEYGPVRVLKLANIQPA
jgi:hypothetical protein